VQADGGQVTRDVRIAGGAEFRDAALGLARALGRQRVERIQPAPGVGVEREARRRLGAQVSLVDTARAIESASSKVAMRTNALSANAEAQTAPSRCRG